MDKRIKESAGLETQESQSNGILKRKPGPMSPRYLIIIFPQAQFLLFQITQLPFFPFALHSNFPVR
jgi:hypothetical protein